MLKFELTRFEAQDVITTSGVATAPTTPAAPACICDSTGSHGYNSKTGIHRAENGDGTYTICEATVHTCGYGE